MWALGFAIIFPFLKLKFVEWSSEYPFPIAHSPFVMTMGTFKYFHFVFLICIIYYIINFLKNQFMYDRAPPAYPASLSDLH